MRRTTPTWMTTLSHLGDAAAVPGNQTGISQSFKEPP